MPTIRISVQVTVDDVPISNFPLFQRSAPTSVDTYTTPQPSGPPGLFAAVPMSMTTAQTAIIQSTQALDLAFNGAVATPVTLTAGGVFIMAGTALTAIAADNHSGFPANIRSLIAGV